MPRAKGWTPVSLPPIALIMTGAQAWEKQVEDGTLRILRSKDDGMWHASISFRPDEDYDTRYPTWDEIKEMRYGFLPDKAQVVMALPPKDEFVNIHETTFHLWEIAQ